MNVTHRKYPAELIYHDFVVRQKGSAIVVVRNADIRWDDAVISQVYATACEYRHHVGESRFFHGIECVVGEAKITVSNVAVRPGEVHFRIDVESADEVDVFVRFHVVNMELKPARREELPRPVVEKAVPLGKKAAGKAKKKK